jgi:hypothetical protein
MPTTLSPRRAAEAGMARLREVLLRIVAACGGP